MWANPNHTPTGLQKRQRAEQRDGAACPAMGTEWEQGDVRGHSPGSQSSPGLKHKSGPDWGVEGFLSHLEEGHSLTNELAVN